GIRDLIVTGVETCALPILLLAGSTPGSSPEYALPDRSPKRHDLLLRLGNSPPRSRQNWRSSGQDRSSTSPRDTRVQQQRRPARREERIDRHQDGSRSTATQTDRCYGPSRRRG